MVIARMYPGVVNCPPHDPLASGDGVFSVDSQAFSQ